MQLKTILLLLYYVLNCLVTRDPFAILLTLPMMALCTIEAQLTRAASFGIDDVILVVSYLFFVIGPLQALDHGFMPDGPVGGIYMSPDSLWRAMILILIFFTIFFSVRRFCKSRNVTSSRNFNLPFLAPLLVLNVLAFAGDVIGSGGWTNMLAARADKVSELSNIVLLPSTALQLLTAFLIFSAARLRFRTEPAWSVVAAALAIALLAITENPFNTARYFFIAAWFPVLFIFCKGRLPALPSYVAIFAFVTIAMPVLNLTSREGEGIYAAIAATFNDRNVLENIFHIPFIDVFDMSAFQMQYAGDQKFFWGSKTLGLVLFFVPRSLWTGKATLTGLDLGSILEDSQNAGTNNLSFFVGGDFYADAGLVGVALGAVLVSFLMTRVILARNVIVNEIDLTSAILIAAMPILIRGPLGANVGLTLLELLGLALFSRLFGVYVTPASAGRGSKRSLMP